MTWSLEWSQMVENGGGGNSMRSLVHSLQEWDAVPGSGLATGLSNTQERSQKSCFLIYDTILRKMKIMTKRSLRSRQTTFSEIILQLQLQDIQRSRRVGVDSSPLRSRNYLNYANLWTPVSGWVLVRFQRPDRRFEAENLKITNMTSMISFMRVKIIINSNKSCYSPIIWASHIRFIHTVEQITEVSNPPHNK